MGNKRNSNKLFRIRDFMFEISDLIVVARLALSRKNNGKTLDPGMYLAQLTQYFDELLLPGEIDSKGLSQEMYDEYHRNPVDNARLHPVLKGLYEDQNPHVERFESKRNYFFIGKDYDFIIGELEKAIYCLEVLTKKLTDIHKTLKE